MMKIQALQLAIVHRATAVFLPKIKEVLCVRNFHVFASNAATKVQDKHRHMRGFECLRTVGSNPLAGRGARPAAPCAVLCLKVAVSKKFAATIVWF